MIRGADRLHFPRLNADVTYNGLQMKLVILGYVLVMALFLTLKPEPAKRGPECGPGVLCIRTQQEVRAALQQAPNVPFRQPTR